MQHGKCHLCGELRDLQESHVWPKFAYKRFVANLPKGGQFADLHKQTLTNDQYTRYWFCHDCEGILSRTETYAAQLLSRIERDPEKGHAYDGRLLRFVTSISWRSLKFHIPGEHPRAAEGQWKAAGAWRRYLRGRAGGVKDYTQHVFNIVGNRFGLDNMLGGVLIPKPGLVLSQIGPLIIVGLLRPEALSPDEWAVWDNSKVHGAGGVIRPLKEWRTWRTGKGDPDRHTITLRFAMLLKSFELGVIERVISTDWSGK